MAANLVSYASLHAASPPLTARRATFAQCFKMHDQLFLGMTGLQSDVDTLCAPSPTGGLARASTCLCGARLASSPRAARRARAHRLQQRVRLPVGSPHVCVCLPGCRYERFRFKLNLVRAAALFACTVGRPNATVASLSANATALKLALRAAV